MIIITYKAHFNNDEDSGRKDNRVWNDNGLHEIEVEFSFDEANKLKNHTRLTMWLDKRVIKWTVWRARK